MLYSSTQVFCVILEYFCQSFTKPGFGFRRCKRLGLDSDRPSDPMMSFFMFLLGQLYFFLCRATKTTTYTKQISNVFLVSGVSDGHR